MTENFTSSKHGDSEQKKSNLVVFAALTPKEDVSTFNTLDLLSTQCTAFRQGMFGESYQLIPPYWKETGERTREFIGGGVTREVVHNGMIIVYDRLLQEMKKDSSQIVSAYAMSNKIATVIDMLDSEWGELKISRAENYIVHNIFIQEYIHEEEFWQDVLGGLLSEWYSQGNEYGEIRPVFGIDTPQMKQFIRSAAGSAIYLHTYDYNKGRIKFGEVYKEKMDSIDQYLEESKNIFIVPSLTQ